MVPFVLPFALYLVLSQFFTQSPQYYPIFYAVSVVIVGAVTMFLLHDRNLLAMHRRIVPGILVGVVGIVAWILISQLQLEQAIIRKLPEWLQPGERSAFNPFLSIESPYGRWSFIAVRLMGLALLVPVVEEIFWRGFLLRWVISPDWQEQEIGRFSLKSFLWITFLFTLAHPEWLAAAVYCIILNLLLYWKKDLWNCIVAHGTSNLLLGVYVISSQTWELW